MIYKPFILWYCMVRRISNNGLVSIGFGLLFGAVSLVSFAHHGKQVTRYDHRYITELLSVTAEYVDGYSPNWRRPDKGLDLISFSVEYLRPFRPNKVAALQQKVLEVREYIIPSSTPDVYEPFFDEAAKDMRDIAQDMKDSSPQQLKHNRISLGLGGVMGLFSLGYLIGGVRSKKD